jgi:hypothetical protein
MPRIRINSLRTSNHSCLCTSFQAGNDVVGPPQGVVSGESATNDVRSQPETNSPLTAPIILIISQQAQTLPQPEGLSSGATCVTL